MPAGSLYIDSLLASIKELGRTKNICRVLQDAQYKVNTVSLETDGFRWKQTPYYESSLQKEFVFP